jgi:branched-chain amino acid transport system permease protein
MFVDGPRAMDLTALLLFQVLNGVVWGLVIGLIALGLALIFGILEVINIAHGSLYMLGAVLAWYIVEKSSSFAVAVVVAPALVGLLSMAMERVVLRPIEKQKVLTIIATTGLMLILQHAALATFGGGMQRIASPTPGSVMFFGLRYPVYRLLVAAFSLLAIGLLWLFLTRTRYGMWLRSVRQDAKMATALGIPVGRVYMIAVGVGGFLAALGGVLAAPMVVIQYQMGFEILATAFIVVVIGGVGSLFGAAAAAILLGTIEGIITVFATPTTARTLSLVVMGAILLARPEGLFRGGR